MQKNSVAKIFEIAPKVFVTVGMGRGEFLDAVLDMCDVREREICRGEFGKPYLRSGEVYFNLSHCGEVNVCVVAEDEVGVDVQKICWKPRVLKHACNTAEAAEIRTAEEFTRMWVLKESFVKCDGRGLAYGLKKIDTRNLKESKVWRWGDFLIAACYNKG